MKDWSYSIQRDWCVIIVWLLDLQLPVQSLSIAIKIVSLNAADAVVYSIQPYVIKFVSDLQ